MSDSIPEVVLHIRPNKQQQPFVIVNRPRVARKPLKPIQEIEENKEKEGQGQGEQKEGHSIHSLVSVPLSPDLVDRVQQLERQHADDEKQITRLSLHNQRLEDAIVSQCLESFPSSPSSPSDTPQKVKRATYWCVLGVVFSAGILALAGLSLWLVYYE